MGSAQFRAGVVIAVTNSQDQLLAFERSDVPGAWQLPQGGIDIGEAPIDAAWRELGEETGLGPEHVRLVHEHPEWVAYEFPPHIRGVRKRLGQVQRWFEFSVVTDDVEPTPDGLEFVAWKWADRSWLVDQVVEFRRNAYRRVLEG